MSSAAPIFGAGAHPRGTMRDKAQGRLAHGDSLRLNAGASGRNLAGMIRMERTGREHATTGAVVRAVSTAGQLIALFAPAMIASSSSSLLGPPSAVEALISHFRRGADRY